MAALAVGEDDQSGLPIVERPEFNGVTLFAENGYTTEYAITLRCTLVNATTSQAFPLAVLGVACALTGTSFSLVLLPAPRYTT